MINIYTDGASTGKVGPGGWGFVVIDSGIRVHSNFGGQDDTTNNQMELYAVTQALSYLINTYHPDIPATIWSDSEYVVKGINLYLPKWLVQIAKGKSKIKNQEWWLELKGRLDLLTNIEVKWVRGHDGNEFNEIADQLAKLGKEAIKLRSKDAELPIRVD